MNLLMKEEQRTETKADIYNKDEEYKSEEIDWMVRIDEELFGKSREKR